MSITEDAYEYAKSKKKVSEPVMEAYRAGYIYAGILQQEISAERLLQIAFEKLRSVNEIEYQLAMSDVRRKLTLEEQTEAQKKSIIEDTIKTLAEINSKLKKQKS